MAIDWQSDAVELRLNPKIRWDSGAIAALRENRTFLGHIWFATSGTQGPPKFVALSKKALLCSAASVNRHFNVLKEDIWLNALPAFHVGGVGVLARAHLSGAKLVNLYDSERPWNPQKYLNNLIDHGITLSALVPTQLFDLVKLRAKPPDRLRALILGGSALNPELRGEAELLGWPIYASYGLTECSSQVATESMDDVRGFRLLDHVAATISQEGRIVLKSDALLSAYGLFHAGQVDFIDPKKDGWFETEDRGIIVNETCLQVFGRDSGFVKIAGESVSIHALQERIDALRLRLNVQQDCALAPLPNERWGCEIGLYFDGEMNRSLQALIDAYNEGVSPLERARKLIQVEKVPRNALGKVIVFEKK